MTKFIFQICLLPYNGILKSGMFTLYTSLKNSPKLKWRIVPQKTCSIQISTCILQFELCLHKRSSCVILIRHYLCHISNTQSISDLDGKGWCQFVLVGQYLKSDALMWHLHICVCSHLLIIDFKLLYLCILKQIVMKYNSEMTEYGTFCKIWKPNWLKLWKWI